MADNAQQEVVIPFGIVLGTVAVVTDDEAKDEVQDEEAGQDATDL